MISIRQAKKEDIKILQDLNYEVYRDNYQYDADLDLEWPLSEKGNAYFTHIVQDPQWYCLIGEEHDKPIGYIAAGPRYYNYFTSKYFEIENMGVILKYRSKGIGSQLIQKCLSWAKQQGYKKIYVNAYFGNVNGISFYKKNGFSEIDLGLQRDL